MNQIVLDFNGDLLVLPFSISTMQVFSLEGVKFSYKNQMYHVVDKVINGVEALHVMYAEWDKKEALAETMDVFFKMKKI
ncbi:MAG: hypothetical protein PHV53_02070 [Fermentimonas sp.]|nr:hypothetical protein [Fermentimonas sp.]